MKILEFLLCPFWLVYRSNKPKGWVCEDAYVVDWRKLLKMIWKWVRGV